MYGGMDADYPQLQATGEQIRKVLAAGKELRISSPGGTDLRVQIAGRPVVVSDGVISAEDRKRGAPSVAVWLPAGEVFLTPVPGTANGVVVADHMFYQGDRIEGLRLEVKNGKMVAMTAMSGLDPLREYYELAGPGKDLFSVVDIGINPSMKVPEGQRRQAHRGARHGRPLGLHAFQRPQELRGARPAVVRPPRQRPENDRRE